MSDPAAPAPEGCPINSEFLPPNMRKHVDPKAPVPLRMMAAKSLVPLPPPDMIGALFMLTFDPDQGVRDTAAKTAAGLPDRILAGALRDEGVQAPALGYFLRALAGKEQYEEMLILNATTPDEDVAACALKCSAKIAETVSQNQLRLLRHTDIIRQLCLNQNATPALLDSVCDFAVRSGVILDDVPQMHEARVRLFGPEAAEQVPDLGPTADEVMAEYAGLIEEGSPPMEEGKRLTLTQKIMKMSVAEKIKLASVGNKEARSLLVRDSNRLVSVAVVRSKRITDGEILTIANNRAAPDDVLRVIYMNREWIKMYPLKVALVKNPKTPSGIAMRFLATLRDSEVKEISRNKNVPSGIQMQAKKMMDKKLSPRKDDK